MPDLHQATQDDHQSLGRLLEEHRDRLRRMVKIRLDQRLRGRIDPSDVVQEAFLEATQRFDAYTAQPDMPFFLWLRFLTGQRLLILHRHHLATEARDVAREVSVQPTPYPAASSAALAAHLAADQTSPSEAAARAELRRQIQETLERMGEADREALSLRHFERLSNREAARELGISEAAATKRYVRALRRLRKLLETPPTDFP